MDLKQMISRRVHCEKPVPLKGELRKVLIPQPSITRTHLPKHVAAISKAFTKAYLYSLSEAFHDPAGKKQ